MTNPKTASTRHLIDTSFTVGGDEGVSNEWLLRVITEALEAAGAQPLAIQVSPDLGLGAENVAVVLDDGEAYSLVPGCSLVRLPDEVAWHDFEDHIEHAIGHETEDLLLRF